MHPRGSSGTVLIASTRLASTRRKAISEYGGNLIMWHNQPISWVFGFCTEACMHTLASFLGLLRPNTLPRSPLSNPFRPPRRPRHPSPTPAQPRRQHIAPPLPSLARVDFFSLASTFVEARVKDACKPARPKAIPIETSREEVLEIG